MRRVLFVHIGKTTPDVPMPHLGLASLAAVLRQAGHEAVILDEVLYPVGSSPALADVIARVQPDVIGFSAYTSTCDRLLEYLRAARAVSAAPTMIGGPHASLFPGELQALEHVDYVVTGEAETIIVDLVSQAERQPRPVVVAGQPADVSALPWPDYTAVLDSQAITIYPIMTSRGCPFRCSFCAVAAVGARQWRPREPADCVAEIKAAAAQFPKLATLNVSDDCPTFRLDRFKEFLRLLIAEHLSLELDVDNMRADRVDAELVALLKQAGATMQCIGVESGNPEVFALVNKGETLEDVIRGAELIKQGGLQLRACFVIGLPGDTLDRHRDSVRLARRLKPFLIFWNMAHPFPGTAMHQWFVEHSAQVDDPRTYTSYDRHTLEVAEPVVGTPEFTKWERQRAYLLAVMETDQYVLDRRGLGLLWRQGTRYHLLGPALRSLTRRLLFGGIRRIGRKLSWAK